MLTLLLFFSLPYEGLEGNKGLPRQEKGWKGVFFFTTASTQTTCSTQTTAGLVDLRDENETRLSFMLFIKRRLPAILLCSQRLESVQYADVSLGSNG